MGKRGHNEEEILRVLRQAGLEYSHRARQDSGLGGAPKSITVDNGNEFIRKGVSSLSF